MLIYPKEAAFFAKQGLLVWFQVLIPTLLPFMILSTFLIKLNLHRVIVKILTPITTPLFHLNPDSIYCIVFGFLCGFPMGAKIVTELYDSAYISKQEAAYLLAFCNNIGPVYFTSIVLTQIPLSLHIPFLAGFYGIPLLYGIILRHTVYKNLVITNSSPKISLRNNKQTDKQLSFFDAIDESVVSALSAITHLGGYMILFNLYMCLSGILFSSKSIFYHICNCLIEISGGIQGTLQSILTFPQKVFVILPLLTFTGCSCFAQTIAFINHTDLSLLPYFLHKVIQSLLLICYLCTLQFLFHIF